jgi:nucleoside-diphosphate-sugar epimerase
MAPRRVLVTGMSGLIGGALRRHLEGRYELSALNRRPIPGVTCHQGNIADLDAIAAAFTGIDTVVHLAARTGESEVFGEILQANVIGTYNVFEAARRAAVSRVIYASSGATVSAWERDPPYCALVAGRYDEAKSWKTMTHEMPLRPAGLYGASKIWGEAIARHYADVHGLSAICVRIGRVLAADRPTTAREFSVFCSQRDVVRMLELCIAAPPTLTFDIFYAISDNRWGYRDLEHARRVLGFEPMDRAEDYRR